MTPKITIVERGEKRYEIRERARLAGADLSGADLSGVNLRRSDLRRASLVGAVLVKADLKFSNLAGSDLRGADLKGADLSWANLKGCDLSGADLTGSFVRGANMVEARLYGTRFLPLGESELPRGWRVGNDGLVRGKWGRLRQEMGRRGVDTDVARVLYREHPELTDDELAKLCLLVGKRGPA